MALPAWITLLESGSALLLEDGTNMLLEGQDGPGRVTTSTKASATTTVTVTPFGGLTVQVTG